LPNFIDANGIGKIIPKASSLAKFAGQTIAVAGAGAAGYAAGTALSKGYEELRGGKGSIGSDLFSLFDNSKGANEISSEAIAKFKNQHIIPSPKTQKSDASQNINQDAIDKEIRSSSAIQQAQQIATTQIVQQNSTPIQQISTMSVRMSVNNSENAYQMFVARRYNW